MKRFFSMNFFFFRSLLVSVKTRSSITSKSVNFVGDNTNNGGNILFDVYLLYIMYKSKLIYVTLLFVFSIEIDAQILRTNNWNFGNGVRIDFRDAIIIQTNSKISSFESCASISDNKGDLELYSDGVTIWDKMDSIIINGDSLYGNQSSSHGAVFVSFDSVYYLFYTNYSSSVNNELYYSKIIKQSKFRVIEKNIVIKNNNCEPIAVINNSSNNSSWICVKGYKDSLIYSYLVTKSGLVKCPIISNSKYLANNSFFSAQIDFTFSPDGQKACFVNLDQNYIHLFDFNSRTGVFSSEKIISGFNFPIAGICFSHNSNYLYITERDDNLVRLQINKTSLNEIINSKIQLQLQNNTKLDIVKTPNKKIGLSIVYNQFLSIIDSVDVNTNSIIFKKDAVSLQNKQCYKGLPNFNQSYFYTPAINYTYEMNCTKNSIQFWGKDTFGANNHNWYIRKIFGANNYQLIGNSKDINYTFADTGTYEVRYIASNGNKIDTVVKSIVLYDKIKQDFLGKDTAFAQGVLINKTLYAPTPNHCVRWYDPSPKERGTGSSLLIDSVGTYICKVTNQAFCEVWDTIVINECINNLTQPSLFRSRDTLRTWHLNADSFVWYRNNQIYKVTKQPFLALTDTGTYRVEAAKKGHCNRGSVGQLLVNKLSVKGIRIEELGIRVFPNPSSGLVKIEGEVEFSLEIRDVLGRVIEQLKYEDQNSSPLLGRGVRGEVFLPKGIYFFHFDVGAYKSVEKVVVY